MTIALWMILAAALLPYFTTGAAKMRGSGFDNADPRGWQARQTGLVARLTAAQSNHFESFPVFAASVLVAAIAHAPQATADLLAVLYVAIRVLYTVAYAANTPTLRSAVWACGLGCVVGLFIISA